MKKPNNQNDVTKKLQNLVKVRKNKIVVIKQGSVKRITYTPSGSNYESYTSGYQ